MVWKLGKKHFLATIAVISILAAGIFYTMAMSNATKSVQETVKKLYELANPGTQAEVLTQAVQGQPASDIEERFARALYKNERVEDFEFQQSYFAGRNMPGEVRPDFIVYAGTVYPVQIDGEYAHKSAEQKATDRAKDAQLDGYLTPMGAAVTQRISGDLLQTQEDADRLVQEMF